MKKILLLGLYWLVAVSTLAITTPEKINYQGVARSADGTLLVNQKLGIQIQIRTVEPSGNVVYSETHTVITNQYGLFSLQIGDGSVELGIFELISWESKAFVELSIDFEGGDNYASMGISELVSVPYALHAKSADNVFTGNYNDLANAPVNLSDFVNDQSFITSADNTDSDATNEIQDLSLVGSTLKITNNANATEINLAPFSGTNTDEQTLSVTGTNLFISNGNAVSLASIQDGFEANTDAQSLSLVGTNLSITGGNTLDVSALQDGFEANTDAQTLSLVGTNLTITGGNTLDVSVLQDGFEANTDTQLSEAEVDTFVANNGYLSTEIDGSITNEIQDLSLVGSTLKITNNASATAIDLSPFAGSNTDEQTLSLSGTTLSISNGNNVNLSSLQDGTGTDAQVISLSGSNLTISGGNSINISSIDTKLTEGEVDTFVANNGYITSEVDGSTTNELQTLALSGANLSISNKNTVDLSGLDTDTNLTEAQVDGFVANNGYLTSEVDGSTTNELQTLALIGTNLSISGKNTVDLSSVQDGTGTDSQSLSLSGTTLSISNGNSVVLPGGGGTDDQVIDEFVLLANGGLYLSLENDGQPSKVVDLSPLKDGTGTDDQTIDYFALTGSTLYLSLEDDAEANKSVDLSKFESPFKTTTGVISNGKASNDPSYTSDDFVFGSYRLDQASAALNSRMYFDKSKGAFRAGEVNSTQWNTANVGLNSTAFGKNTIASASLSFAAGNGTSATGIASSAFGSVTQATGNYSTAFGQNSTASGSNSFVAGASLSASAGYSVAFGISSTASGNTSFAQGSTAVAGGSSAIAMGSDVSALGSYSLALGKKLYTNQLNAFVIGTGSNTTATQLANNQANSLLVGFNATPSLMVQESKVTIFKVMHLTPLSSPPAGGVMGDMYVATNGKLYFHNGTIWKEVSLVP